MEDSMYTPNRMHQLSGFESHTPPVRAGPDAQCRNIGTLELGDAVSLIGITFNFIFDLGTNTLKFGLPTIHFGG